MVMGATGPASTGQRAKMSVGFGKAANPMQPQAIQQPQIDPNQVIANMDQTIAATIPGVDMEAVQAAQQAAPNMAQASPMTPPHPASVGRTDVPTASQVLRFPDMPETSPTGAPEVCLVTRGRDAQFSPMFYGTDEERQTVRDTLLNWADDERVDTIIFFMAHEWYSRKLQKGTPNGGTGV